MSKKSAKAALKNFPEIIRELRCSKGLTQEELAERANLHFTYISQIERGLKSPSLRTLSRIADALEVRLYSIIEKIEKEKIKI